MHQFVTVSEWLVIGLRGNMRFSRNCRVCKLNPPWSLGLFYPSLSYESWQLWLHLQLGFQPGPVGIACQSGPRQQLVSAALRPTAQGLPP